MDEISLDAAASELAAGENTPVVDDSLAAIKSESDALVDALVEQEKPPEAPQKRVEKIKVDGEEREVAFDDLIASHQKVSAADKRLQEAAEIRKNAESMRLTIEQDRKNLAEATKFFKDRAAQLLPKPPDRELMHTDLSTYVIKKEEYEIRTAEIAQAEAVLSHLQGLQEKQEELSLPERKKAAREMISKEIPSWSDPEKALPEQIKVSAHMRKMGLSEERIAAIDSAKAENAASDLIAYRESALYRELLAQAKERTKQITKPAPRVERSGTGERAPSGLLQKFNKSGSFNDALAALNSGELG